MEPVGCTGTLVNNYQSTLCNIPEEQRSQDNGRIAMCMENNDLQTNYFFNSHVIHIRPTLSASY